MPQQLGEHAQSLVGEILVDEGFLPGQSLCRAAGGLVVVFLARCGNFREKLGHRRQTALPSSFSRGIPRLPENKLAAGSVVAKVKPVQNP